MERQKHKLDIIKGSQRILSNASSRICCCGKDFHGTCLCLVGSAYVEKKYQIRSKVKTKYWLRTHKFWIRIPKSVEEVKHFDQENGDTLWWEAICNEMRNVRPAFEVWEKDVKHIPPGYQQIKCHMIFDVKMGENFRHKVRFVTHLLFCCILRLSQDYIAHCGSERITGHGL